MVDFLLFLGILIPALLLGTTIAVAPAVALSFYLAPSGATARTNITVGVATALVGVFLSGLVFDPVARTPPAQAYVIVGAWVGGTLGVGIAAVVQFLTNRRGFCLQRSLKSWFIVLTLMCLGCALIKFVWSRQW